MRKSQRGRGKEQAAKAGVAVAVQALTYLAGDPARLSGFLAATGLEPASIRAAAVEPQFLAGVLDYLAQDEALLLAFAADAGLLPGEVEQARRTLSGTAWERETP